MPDIPSIFPVADRTADPDFPTPRPPFPYGSSLVGLYSYLMTVSDLLGNATGIEDNGERIRD